MIYRDWVEAFTGSGKVFPQYFPRIGLQRSHWNGYKESESMKMECTLAKGPGKSEGSQSHLGLKLCLYCMELFILHGVL